MTQGDDGARWLDLATVVVTQEPFDDPQGTPSILYRVHWDDPGTGSPDVSAMAFTVAGVGSEMPVGSRGTIGLGMTGAKVVLRVTADRTMTAWLEPFDQPSRPVAIIAEADYQ